MKKLLMIPGPTNVPERVLAAMCRPMIGHRSEDFHNLFKGIVEKAKLLFRTSGDVVLLTSSGTGGVEASVQNLIKRGDKAIVPIYGEFCSRAADAIERVGGEVIRVEARLGSVPRVEELREAFEEAGEVKLLFIVYNETSTGVAFRRIREASKLASEHGAYFVVDAISNFAGDELEFDSMGMDLCVAASQKCLAAPPGVSLIALSKRVREYLEGERPTTLYFDLIRHLKYEEKCETPFTPSVPIFQALDEALELALEEGLERRWERHRRCSNAFYSAFEAMGLTLFAEEDARSTTTIAVRYPEGVDDEVFRRKVEERGVLIAGGFGGLKGKVFRVGCMGIVNKEMVLKTVDAIAEAMKDFGVEVDKEAALEAVESEC